MVPNRHGATAWKRWIFCPTDHLDFENLENRRRYHNPGKPRTAGLCGREVVASDHLPLSSTFFGWPKSSDLPPKPAAVVPLPRLFSLWRYPRKMSSPTSAHTGRTRLAASSASSDAAPSTKASHSPSQAATRGLLSSGSYSLDFSWSIFLLAGSDGVAISAVDVPGLHTYCVTRAVYIATSKLWVY